MDKVKYIDENGNTQTKDGVTVIATVSDLSNKTLTGWYVVTSKLTCNGTLIISGDVHLILGDGCELTVTPSSDSPGIKLETTNSLTIYGQSLTGSVGILKTNGTSGSAGIGSSKYGWPSGAITINGGNITVTGGSESAGIGSNASNEVNGAITINGGTVTASTGNYGAGIGGGRGKAGGTITINGGNIKATGGGSGAGIGGGEHGSGGTITITGGTINATGLGGAGIGGGDDVGSSLANGGTIRITGGTINATSTNGAGIGGGSNAAGGNITIDAGDITAIITAGRGAGIGGGGGGTAGTIIINGGDITAKGGTNASMGGAGIGGGGGNTGPGYGGVKSGDVTINSGNINAQGGERAAGIGGGSGNGLNNLTINGGTIVATGGNGGAGIGCGMNGHNGSIIINNGNITATGTGRGAGIGNAESGGGSSSSETTNITIRDGTITATGGSSGSGISGGGMDYSTGTINIYGGNITVAGGRDSQAISGNGGFTVSGGAITATSGGIYGGKGIISGNDTRINVLTGTPERPLVGGNTVVMLPKGNLLGKDNVPLGVVKFTSIPTSTGTVKATFTYPLDSLGTTDILTGLNGTGKEITFIIPTTVSVSLTLAGLANSPVTRTAAQLSAPGASVNFRDGYCVNVTLVGEGYGAVDYTVSTGVTGTLTRSDFIEADDGSTVTLTYRELNSGKFVSWSGAANSLAGQVAFTSTTLADVNETVTFAAPGGTWNLKLDAGGGSATVRYDNITYPYDAGAGGINIPFDSSVSVYATPPTGTTFAYWYGYENINTPSFSIPSNNRVDRQYSARFVTDAEKVTITFGSDPTPIGAKYYFKAAAGSAALPDNYAAVSGSLIVGRGDNVSVKTDAAYTYSSIIYTFTKWTEGSDHLSDDLDTVIPDLATGADARSLTAVFGSDTIDIIFSPSPSTITPAPTFSIKRGGASYFTNVASGKITVNKSEQVVIRTTVPSGYAFLRWADSENEILSNNAESEALPLSSYGNTATFTAMFAATGDAVTVHLGSTPSGAALYYRIGTLKETSFASDFKVEKNETLRIRADLIYGAFGFQKWEDSASTTVSTSSSYTVPTPIAGTPASFNAVYDRIADTVEVTLARTSGASSELSYSINGGSPITYDAPFSVDKTDTLSVTASPSAGYVFSRWQDSEDSVLSTAAASGPIDLSAYMDEITFTAVFIAEADAVRITLSSDPNGPALFFTIGDLKEAGYTTAFYMGRSESLGIRTDSSDGSYTFLRWEDTTGSPGKAMGTGKSVSGISLPSGAASASYTALYDAAGEAITVTLMQTVGARATLMYSLNGTDLQYTGPFAVRPSDAVSATAVDIGMYEFLRWYDSEGNVLSTEVSTGEVDLSIYVSAVTLTAVFTAPGDKVMVSMLSDPEGADLLYAVGGLNPTAYTKPFAMGRSENLTIEAPAAHAGIDFLRWEGPAGVIGNSNTESGISMPASGTTVTYKAVYAPASEQVTITLDQTSGAGATLGYTLNSISYTYGGSPFTVKKSDTFVLTADVPSGYEFLRWRDSEGGTVSKVPTSGTVALSSYDNAVTFSAMFETTANTITVSLVSDPQGASLSYGIDDLNAIPYGGPFKMGRSELLTVNASPANGKNTFVRWEDSGGIIGSTAEVSNISMPSSGNAASYMAVYALPGDQLTITLEYTGAASADLEYALNGQTFTYSGQFTVIKSDTLTITAATSLSAYGFLRWTDSDGNIVSETALSGNIRLYDYSSETAFTAAFALSADIVTVTLDSDPTGAELYYSVGQLNETMFTASFNMSRSETLSVRAPTMFSGDGFARWEGPGGAAVGRTASVSGISMPSAGASAVYTALYASLSDLIEITLDQTGGADAVLECTVNGDTFTYSDPFRVIRTDTLSIAASVPSGFEFIRWQDSDGNIVSETESSGSVGLSEYGSSVTLTAVFSAAGGKILITLESEPPGAGLHYIIGSLKEIDYTGTFAMSRNETLSIHSAISHEGEDFVRWLDSAGGIASYLADSDDIDVSGYGEAVTFTAVFAAGEDIVTVTLASNPAGSVIMYTIVPAASETESKETRYTGPFKMTRSETLSVRAGDISGKVFDRWEDSSGTIVGTELLAAGLSVSLSGETETFTAYFIDGEISIKHYYITATSDNNSTISPSGKISVPGGASQTFTFKAKEGYVIAEVIVDGRSLSQQEIDAGSYTFRDVNKNSTIDVKSTTSSIVLVVSVVEGKGYAEYSVNGGNFVTYSAPVPLQAGWSVVLRAYADNEYAFKEWRTSSAAYTTSEVSFNNVSSSVRLSLYFTSSEGDGAAADDGIDVAIIIAAAVIVALLTFFLIWWLFFFRRSYAVTVISEATVRGKERARRKKAYVFSVEGASGTVSYKVGEEGQWKVLTPGPDGKYTIPRREVVDNLTIEHR